MLETVKEIAKYPLRIPSALAKAVKKARENQDSGFFEKLGIFFSAFTDAMRGIEKERNAVSKGVPEFVFLVDNNDFKRLISVFSKGRS